MSLTEDSIFADMPSLKLISATDTEYSAAVLKSFNEQRTSGLFCDITIIIRDKKFRAHKTMLSASSTYFHQLFTVAGQVIELNFIRAEIFEEILNYIYTSKIIRVRSDMLEELIHAGKILGVKFIANLALPLSQVKGLPGLSKEPENKTDTPSEVMPIIAESFSISAEEFNQASKPGDDDDDNGGDDDSDSDDVMFVSQTTTAELKTNAEVIDLEGTDSDNTNIATVQQEVTSPQKTYSVQLPLSTTKDSTPINSPSGNSHNLSSPRTVPTTSTNLTHNTENNGVIGVHKKLITAAGHQGDLNIRLVNVYQSPAIHQNNTSTCDIGAKQTVMRTTAAEMGPVSPDCRVYANIGENTYDIVTSKDDPGEGASTAHKEKKAYMLTLNRPTDPTPISPKVHRKRRKGQTESEEQHYELVMDGKTFYVCVVCKRPYVCLTSLRRHFNTHSWEKKYPCRHCNKVFALAEYRTKHELCHTGERRYQCLLCSEMFVNYQLLSTHCKQIHSQDPSGRKAKDEADNNLYRLLPYSGKRKAYSWVTDESEEIPSDVTSVISEDGNVHLIENNQQDCTQSRMLNWDDIFLEPEADSGPGSSVNNSNKREEFDFAIPETY